MMIQLVEATCTHAEQLAPNARHEDLIEWVLGTGERLLPRLKQAVTWPHGFAKSAILEGRPVSIWGVHDLGHTVTLDAGTGVAWLIATPEALKHVHALHRFAKSEIAAIDSRWERMIAWSHHDNRVHHEWLRWLGFEQYQRTTLEFPVPFITFIRKRSA